jgi:ABC-type glycerol-3-phosphate transport system permease component
MNNITAIEKAADDKKRIDISLDLLRNTILNHLAHLCHFPALWMFICSLKSDAEVVTTVFKFTPVFSNYQAVLFPPIPTILRPLSRTSSFQAGRAFDDSSRSPSGLRARPV